MLRKLTYLLALWCAIGVAGVPRGAQSNAENLLSAPQPFAVQLAGAPVVAQLAPTQDLSRKPDVIYVPTPPEVVAEMLRMANVQTGDVLYDLGSGDGRIPITAARQFGIQAVGIDIDPQRVAEANENAQAAGVTDKVQFIHGDLFQADFSEATVVTLYLLESLNEKLRPKLLRELQPGARIVSHDFRMGDWQPEQKANVNGRMVYFWTVPAKKASGQ